MTVEAEFEEITEFHCGIVSRGTLRKRSETCCVCKTEPNREGQRTCNKCHADLMKMYRKGFKGGKVPPVNVEIEDVQPGAPLLSDRESKYEQVYERMKSLDAGRAFRAKFQGKHTAKNARTAALQFADRLGIQITTSVAGETLEVMRLEKPEERRK